MTSTAAITLRPIILPDDLEFLILVYGSTRAGELSVVDWPDAQKETFVRSQFKAQHDFYQAHYGDSQFSVIMQHEQPIGRLYVQRQPDRLLIVDITILPDYQHQGTGTALLQALIAEANEMQRPIQIHVEQFNPVLHWYQKLGFQPVELQGIYFQMERQPEHVRP